MSQAGTLVPEPNHRDPRDLTADPEAMEAENRAWEEGEMREHCAALGIPYDEDDDDE